MKKLILFTLLGLMISGGVFAQGSNPFTPGSGALPAFTVGSQYDVVINISVPTTATIDPSVFGALPGGISVPPFDATVDTVRFTVTGLPAGLSGVFSNGTGVYLGGASGTLTITGVPSSSASSTINVTSTTSGSGTLQVPLVGALPISFPGVITIPLMGSQAVPAAPGIMDGGPYTLGTVGVQELNISKFDVIQNIPNPFSGNTTIKFSTPNAGNIEFTVFDMIGKVVYSEKIQAQAKTNSFNFNAEKLSPGSYFYSLNNGNKTITKKMIVSGK